MTEAAINTRTETTIKPTLYVLAPDESLHNLVSTELRDGYSPSFFKDITECLAAISEQKADLILCQQSSLVDQQTAVLAQIKAADPEVAILVTGSNCPINIQISLLKDGARGYFDSSLSATKLDEALQCVLLGEVWVERHVISSLIDELTHVPKITQKQRQAVASLSPKELEVAKLVSYGSTNKMIAKKMDITERTVKSHLTTIFHKMTLPDRLSLAIFFRDLR